MLLAQLNNNVYESYHRSAISQQLLLAEMGRSCRANVPGLIIPSGWRDADGRAFNICMLPHLTPATLWFAEQHTSLLLLSVHVTSPQTAAGLGG